MTKFLIRALVPAVLAVHSHAVAQSAPRSYPKGQAYQLTINNIVTETCFWRDVQRALTSAAQQPDGIRSARLVTMDPTSPKAVACKASYDAYAARKRRG